MQRPRPIFKASLRREQAMRAETKVSKLRSSNMISFWKEIKSIAGRKQSLLQNIDLMKDNQNIAEIWRGKYSAFLNNVDDQREQVSVSTLLNDLAFSAPDLVCPEICLCAGELAIGKSSRFECIHSEFFKYAPTLVFKFLSCFVNSAWFCSSSTDRYFRQTCN